MDTTMQVEQSRYRYIDLQDYLKKHKKKDLKGHALHSKPYEIHFGQDKIDRLYTAGAQRILINEAVDQNVQPAHEESTLADVIVEFTTTESGLKCADIIVNSFIYELRMFCIDVNTKRIYAIWN